MLQGIPTLPPCNDPEDLRRLGEVRWLFLVLWLARGLLVFSSFAEERGRTVFCAWWIVFLPLVPFLFVLLVDSSCPLSFLHVFWGGCRGGGSHNEC